LTPEVIPLARLLKWLPLVLLLTGAASAQPPLPAREYVERRVTVPSNAEEQAPEIRVATNVLTVLRFDAPIDRASVEVDGRKTRFRMVDPGDQTLSLEPSVEPGAGEKLVLRVRYKGSTFPNEAVFALVSDPKVVDKEVEVVRLIQTPEAMAAEIASLKSRCEANGPASLALSGSLDSEGVRAQRIVSVQGAPGGLELLEGLGFRASSWSLVSFRLRNLPGQPPWAVAEVRLITLAGTSVKVLPVRMDRSHIAPGEEGLVVVETERPFWKAGEKFRLELIGRDGRTLPFGTVQL
jgi:uncharacterized protein (TIGR02268 family)